MEQFFLSIFSFFSKRRPLFWVLTISVFALAIFVGMKIKLEEDISKFLPKDPEIARINSVFSEINVADKIIVNVSLRDSSIENNPDEIIRWAEVFADSLENLRPKLISDINFKTDDSKMMEVWDFVFNSLPYLLDEKDYQKIDSLLNKQQIAETLKENKKILVSPAGLVLKKSVVKDPLHLSNIVLQKFNELRIDGKYILFDGCIFTRDKKNLLLFIDAAHPVNATAINQILIDKLDELTEAIKLASGNTIDVHYFGGPAVAVSNASQIKRDSYFTSIVAVVLIFILLSLYFKRKTTVFYLLVPVLFGVAFSLAVLYFLKTEISAIAIGAGSAIFGIAINYSLHFLTHYQHVGSVKQTLKDISTPMTIGSLTTVGAFLSLLYVSSEALQDFGLFSALTLIGTILFVLVVLPQSYAKKKIHNGRMHRPMFIDRIASIRPERNNFFLLAIFVLTIFFAFYARNVKFDGEFASINYVSENLEKAHEKLARYTDIDNSTVYCIAKGKDLNEALKNHENAFPVLQNLQEQSNISSFAGINNLLPSEELQIKRLNLWNSFWETRKEKVMDELHIAGAEAGFRQSAFDSFKQLVETEYDVQQVEYFQPFINTFFSDFITILPDKAMVYSLMKIEDGGNDRLVKEFENKEGIIVYDQFYISKVLVKLLSADFNFVLFFCGLLVFAFLTISFGRIELSLISFMPMLVSWIWILGLMSLFGIRFNIINIIISTFIFGLGDDFSIFMTEGLMQEYSHKRKSIRSYKTAMLLSAFTMIIGIGVLVFAKHPAMKSLGAVTLIGMITVVILSYTISPFLFKWLTTKSGKLRQTPLTFRNLAKSIYSFIFFLFGSLGLNILGFILFAYRKKPNLKNKLRYHKVLQKLTAFVVRNMPGVDTTVVNKHNETFEKPAIITCNHQSHIDLMLTMMLTPKIIILTNQWVWNSPFYGEIVKYADFYPVASGIEESVGLLESKVKEGYSILIFPEGTRSVDCSIKRFHKGAFFLAEKLNIDVLPIMIHGVGHRVTKGELVLKPGKMMVSILKRVSPDDKSFGENYSKRAKAFRQLYKKEYNEAAKTLFTPDYFKYKIVDSYIFKGALTEWYARLSLKANNNYQAVLSKIPELGNHLDLFCGKGVFPLLLSFVKSKKNIWAFDKIEEDILLAQNITSKPGNLQFVDDIKTIDNQKFDSISILDGLQKYNEKIQKEILAKAIDRLETGGRLIISQHIKKSKSYKMLSRLSRADKKNYAINREQLNEVVEKYNCGIDTSEEDGMKITVITSKEMVNEV